MMPNHEDQITIGMASIPERETGMKRTLETLLPTCDNFDVYLNRYPANYTCDLFKDPKVSVFRGEDIGARGKMYTAHRTPGYYLTVDDDLFYPPDYSFKMVQAIDKYKRQAFVGGHGVIFCKDPDPAQPQMRILFSHAAEVPLDLPVHMLGTGVMGFHSSTYQIDWKQFEPGKIDEQVAIIGQNFRIPMVCIKHPDNWVREDDQLKLVCALRRDRKASEAAVNRRKRIWDIYIPTNWKEYQKFP